MTHENVMTMMDEFGAICPRRSYRHRSKGRIFCGNQSGAILIPAHRRPQMTRYAECLTVLPESMLILERLFDPKRTPNVTEAGEWPKPGNGGGTVTVAGVELSKAYAEFFHRWGFRTCWGVKIKTRPHFDEMPANAVRAHLLGKSQGEKQAS